MICLIRACTESCPDGVLFLAWIGVIVLWLLSGFIGGAILKSLIYASRREDLEGWRMMTSFGPLSVIAAVIYWFIEMIIAPIKIADLREDVLSNADSEEDLDEMKGSKKNKFSPGDIITGIKGNPDGYQVAYEGCKCKVLRINEIGSMKILLLDHIDKEAQSKNFGNVYTAPARNFILYSESKYAKKNKSSKGKKR